MSSSLQAGRVFPVGRRRGSGGGCRGRQGWRRQSGMVTVEIAFASLGAAAALVLLAWTLSLVMLLGLCNDLATSVARQEARGDQAAVAKILQAKPDGARVSIRQQAEQVTVDVVLAARPWADWLPSVPMSASATVIREPT